MACAVMIIHDLHTNFVLRKESLQWDVMGCCTQMDSLKQSASDESTANFKFVDRFMHHVQAKVTVLVLIRIAIRIAIGITIKTTIHHDIAKSKCTQDDLFSAHRLGATNLVAS